jgi:hypothetical protein
MIVIDRQEHWFAGAIVDLPLRLSTDRADTLLILQHCLVLIDSDTVPSKITSTPLLWILPLPCKAAFVMVFTTDGAVMKTWLWTSLDGTLHLLTLMM